MNTVMLDIRKGGIWDVIINRSHSYSFTSPRAALPIQLTEVLHKVQQKLESDFSSKEAVVCSLYLPKEVKSAIEYSFPDFVLHNIRHAGMRQRFFELFRMNAFNSINVRPNNSDTLYVCSDASAMPERDVAIWAWVSSEGLESQYGYGTTSYGNHSDSAELEGILQGIIANRHTSRKRIHVYSDCAPSVIRVQEILESRTPETVMLNFPLELRKDVRKAYNVSQKKQVSVSWVRGHKGHRLNEAADFISGFVRMDVISGKSTPHREAIFQSLKFFTD